MGCAEPRWRELAGPYVMNRLTEHERAAFEDHYFECDACFAEVERMQAVALRTAADSAPSALRAAGTLPRQSRVWWPVAAAAGVVLLAGLGLWVRSQNEARHDPVAAMVDASSPADATQVPSVQTAGPEVGTTEAAAPVAPSDTGRSDSEPFTLAEVTAPHYERVVLRGPEGIAGEEFERAMERYARGDYPGALTGLEQVSRLESATPRMHFFLGATYLLTGQPDASIQELSRVVSAGDSPYLEEARLLIAQSHLIKGDLPMAEHELEQVLGLNGDFAGEARLLLDRVGEERSRPRMEEPR